MSKSEDFLKWNGWAGVAAIVGIASLVAFVIIATLLFLLEQRQQETRQVLEDVKTTANVEVEEKIRIQSLTTWNLRVRFFNKGPAVAPRNDIKLELFDDLEVDGIIFSEMRIRGFGGQPLNIEPFFSEDKSGIIIPGVPRLGRERDMVFEANIEVSEACGQSLVAVGPDARKLIENVSFGEPQIVLDSGLERKGQAPDACLKEVD